MDAEEAVAQKVFPLGDAGFVAVGVAGSRDDADFGVVGFHVGDIGEGQCHAFPFGKESDGVRSCFLSF